MSAILMLVSILIIAYTQYQLTFQINGLFKQILVRLILVITGVTLGCVYMYAYHALAFNFESFLAVVLATGAVHVPAAIILFLKNQRARQLDK